MKLRAISFLSCLMLAVTVFADSPLKPVKTESPRATMQSFMQAMDDYRKGLQSDNDLLKSRINDAVRTLNLETITHTDKRLFGRGVAILLKETIDRVILVDFLKIPSERESKELVRWRLKDTEITIVKVKDGDREGEFLFSRDTVLRANSFFERVKNIPYVKGSGGGAGHKAPWYEQKFPDWLADENFGVPNWQVLGLFLFILLGFVVKAVVTFLVDQLKRITSKSKNIWDDRIIDASEITLGSIACALFWLIGIRLLHFEGNAFMLFDIIIKLMLSYYLIKLASQLVDVFADILAVKAARTDFPLDDQLVPMIRKSMRLFTVVFGVLIAIQNLGVNVVSVLAGLGLGGLAFALAAKDACANLFGSVMILMDRPFRVGDWITVGEVDGTVEEIGFRSTKIRSFYSSLVSIPNSQLANANIDNMGARKHRRVKATLGLTYSTTPEQMEAFLEGLKNIVLANKATVKTGFHVVFHSYGDFSLNVLLYCFLDVQSWSEEMIERQNIYLEALSLAEELGVEYAFPTSSLYLYQTSESSAAALDSNQLAAKSKGFAPGGEQSKPQGRGIYSKA